MHLLFIVNPASGGRRAVATLDPLLARLDQSGHTYEVQLTQGKGHARDLAALARCRDEVDGIIAVGGDGTLHEIVNGVLERRPLEGNPPRLGVVPMGSGNAIALDLNFSSPKDSIDRIAAGRTRPFDVLRVRTPSWVLHAINIIGWGLVAKVGVRSEQLRWVGRQRYWLASLWELLHLRAVPWELIVDGTLYEVNGCLLLACNTRYAGDNMPFAPQARFDDGKIDLFLVPGAPKMTLTRLLARLSTGAHLESPFVRHWVTDRFQLVCDPGEIVNIDGEVVPLAVGSATGSAPGSPHPSRETIDVEVVQKQVSLFC